MKKATKLLSLLISITVISAWTIRFNLPSIFRGALPKDHKNEIILSKSLRNNFIDGLSVDRVNEIAKRINDLDSTKIEFDFNECHNDSIKKESININSEEKSNVETSLISGPYYTINFMKNDYSLLKIFGFEELDIINE